LGGAKRKLTLKTLKTEKFILSWGGGVGSKLGGGQYPPRGGVKISITGTYEVYTY